MDSALLVATPERLPELERCAATRTTHIFTPGLEVRREFLLKRAPAAAVMDSLAARLHRVKFIAHPTANGFYAVGSAEEILQVERELPDLDVTLPQPPPPLKEFIAVKHLDVEETRLMLANRVPSVSCRTDSRLKLLIVEGPPEAIAQLKELLVELDKPAEKCRP